MTDLMRSMDIPHCPCGSKWEGGMGHMNVGCSPPFSTNSYRCFKCGRMALEQGFSGTCLNFALISKEPSKRFSQAVRRWLRGPLNRLLKALDEARAYETVLSVPNPDPNCVDLYFTNTAGRWIKVS
jgi:hypothetical protein